MNHFFFVFIQSTELSLYNFIAYFPRMSILLTFANHIVIFGIRNFTVFFHSSFECVFFFILLLRLNFIPRITIYCKPFNEPMINGTMFIFVFFFFFGAMKKYSVMKNNCIVSTRAKEWSRFFFCSSRYFHFVINVFFFFAKILVLSDFHIERFKLKHFSIM